MGMRFLPSFDGIGVPVAYWADVTPAVESSMGTEWERQPLRPSTTSRDPGVIPVIHDGVASRVSLEAEVPEVLFDGMREFIDSHPHWDQYRVLTSALASFLFQNGCNDQAVTQHYLDGLWLRP